MTEPTILKLSDLSPSELEGVKEKVKSKDPHYTLDEKGGTITIRDPADVSVDVDPRLGVDVENIGPMPEQVRKILEQPFAGNGPAPATESKPGNPEPLPAKEFVPDPADVRNFIRCLMGNIRFCKSYSVFNDMLTFTYGVRTHGQEEDAVFKMMGVPQTMGLSFLAKARMAYSLIKIKVGEQVTEFQPISPGQTVINPSAPMAKVDPTAALVGDAKPEAVPLPPRYELDDRIEFLRRLSQPILQALSVKIQEFDLLTDALSRRADDPKFWETLSAG